MNEARRRAVRSAREKAQLLASSAGVKLGRVLKIRENSRLIPVTQHRSLAADAASAVPIAIGGRTITATVSIDFAIEPSSNEANGTQ